MMNTTPGAGSLTEHTDPLTQDDNAPRFLPHDDRMFAIDQRGRGMKQSRWPELLFPVFSILLLVSLALASCAQGDKRTPLSPAERDASLQRIAADFGRDADLAKTQTSLEKLGLANPTQLIVTLAEQRIAEGRAQAEIVPLARLAEALGARSPRLLAYLAPTATLLPPAPTLAPPSPTLPPTATAQPPTATLAPTLAPATVAPIATPSPTPRPRVVADKAANLRGGPGVNYPLVGQMQAGQELNIIGRTTGSDWWQVAAEGAGQAWVAGTVIKVQGPIDAVPVAKDIPTPPPTFTPAPPPPPSATPKPAVAFTVNVRLKSVGEDAQRCDGGDHNIFVTVKDAAGNPLDGVRVREIFTGQVQVTGAQGKGAGQVQYDIFRGGGGQVEIVDESNNRIGGPSRGMSDDWPDFDLMKAAGYCNCKPHPDDASCQTDLTNKTYLFAVGHYAFVVVFQRTW